MESGAGMTQDAKADAVEADVKVQGDQTHNAVSVSSPSMVGIRP